MVLPQQIRANHFTKGGYMTSDKGPDERSSPILIPVEVDHVDLLNRIARNLDGFILILETAAIGNSAFAAVDSMLRPIYEQLQEFSKWFNNAWITRTTDTADKNEWGVVMARATADQQIENAMRTISNAHREKKLKHTPATFLTPAEPAQKCPFKSTSEFAKYSTRACQGLLPP